jgi:hypothetical protein
MKRLFQQGGPLSEPSVKNRGAESVLPESFTSPLAPAYPQTILKFDEQSIKNTLFTKVTSEPLFTFSRYFFRRYNTDGSLNFKKFIPKLSDKDLVRLLKKIRSEILPSMLRGRAFDVELSPDIYNWPNLEQLMANVLLGPFLYDEQRSGKKYIISEDQFEFYEPPPGHQGLVKNLPPTIDEIGGIEVLYFKTGVLATPKNNDFSSAAEYSRYNYIYPSEETIVNYLRDERYKNIPFDSNSKMSSKFVLYHNLLIPYIF